MLRDRPSRDEHERLSHVGPGLGADFNERDAELRRRVVPRLGSYLFLAATMRDRQEFNVVRFASTELRVRYAADHGKGVHASSLRPPPPSTKYLSLRKWDIILVPDQKHRHACLFLRREFVAVLWVVEVPSKLLPSTPDGNETKNDTPNGAATQSNQATVVTLQASVVALVQTLFSLPTTSSQDRT